MLHVCVCPVRYSYSVRQNTDNYYLDQHTHTENGSIAVFPCFCLLLFIFYSPLQTFRERERESYVCIRKFFNSHWSTKCDSDFGFCFAYTKMDNTIFCIPNSKRAPKTFSTSTHFNNSLSR